MAEQATPTPGAVQAPDIMSRLGNFLGQEPQEQPEQEVSEAVEVAPQAQQPQGDADSSELTADDLPSDDAPVEQPGAVDVFEFDAAGEHLKVSRDEMIKLAQQGHDYTRKTMALAEQVKTFNERNARLAQVEQVQPQLQQAFAQVQAIGAQLQRYQAVDWVALASNDPLEYSKVRAQHDVLVGTFNNANAQFGQMKAAVDQQQAAIKQDILRTEAQKLTERIPAWKDPDKFKAGSQELRAYLMSEGAASEEVDQLSSSLAVSIAYKAMQYDKLLKAKAGKVGLLKTAPPVTRPGAGASPGTANADRNAALSQRLKKSGDIKDAAALLYSRMK